MIYTEVSKMKVKALKAVTGAHNIKAGEIGELPDDIAKVFIEHGCVEEVEASKKAAKTKKAEPENGEE